MDCMQWWAETSQKLQQETPSEIYQVYYFITDVSVHKTVEKVTQEWTKATLPLL